MSLLPQLAIAWTDVSTVSQCFTCVTAGSKVCRDFANERSAYCCGSAESNRACNDRDFCSNNVASLSMQMFACPFNYNYCGGSSSVIKLRDTNQYTINLDYNKNRQFTNQTICYWQLSVDTSVFDLTKYQYFINVDVQSYTGLYMHLNNGTSIKSSGDHIQINGINTGTNYSYSAINNTVYIIIAAFDLKPNINFTYKLFRLNPTQSNISTNITIPNVTTPNITTNVNVTVKSSINLGNPQPVYGILVLMALIVCGVIVFVVTDWITSAKNPKEYEIFDEPAEKQTNRDFHGTNRLFLTNAEGTLGNEHNNHITEMNLIGKEDDDEIKIEDTSMFYQQERNLTTVHDTSTNAILNTYEIQKQKAFSRVHPIEITLPQSQIVPKYEDPKIQSKASFWSRFKGNKNSKAQENVRRFSILDQNSGIMIPVSVQDPQFRLNNEQIQDIKKKTKFGATSTVTMQVTDSKQTGIKIFGEMQ
ncbi:UNKNOWN [Stylonychia lemnae]|uniref:Uncharacterized protein n=1 Tax=Stylonychia lemnae TaxID=5949 RepID=A0A078BD80_STYLE|nr:UNKNOWN [Stylonychia lemnae]|eukprot:CDW91543.1 UNKNOWN [Stylonychia lemnae]